MLIPVKLPKEQKEEIIKRVRAFFEEERSETIGDLAAEHLIDFMIAELGPYLYNKGVEDSRAVILQKASETEDELYSLERPAAGRKRG